MADPLVSVVVSTFDRPARLARLLEGLGAQTLDPTGFEVIVVDNGSGPATAEVLDAAQRGGGLPLRSLRHERTRGPAGGRNSGWRAARAPLIAFTDDDCVPEPGWLAAILEAAGAGPGRVVQGRTEPDPDELQANRRKLRRTVEVTGLGPQYETCNIAYPKAVLEALDGFDESYGLRPAGEDTDLAWRALERGAEFAFAPGALVRHAVTPLGPLEGLRDAYRWGECARLFARHPQAREMLYRGLFWNVWHYLLVRSALALLTPEWLRRFLLARHSLALRLRARELGLAEWWAGYLLLIDVVEAAAMIRGAVRHRTPLL